MKTCYAFILLPLLFVSAIICCREDEPVASAPKKLQLETFVSNVHIPWGMRFLPDGSFLFVERNGRLSVLKQGAKKPELIATRGVEESEGGLLGLAVHPDFEENHFIFLYETIGTGNRVVRLKLINNKVEQETVILSGIPAAENHDGGALDFGPDNYLYIGTGDAKQPKLSQDLKSLAGKILRVDENGKPAPGNPFGTEIWTYGHRNVQGFDWNDQGAMLATEHGPSGEMARCCHDEINYIEKGRNYGWPEAFGGKEKAPMAGPLYETGLKTLAPSGCTFIRGKEWGDWNNNFVLGALKGERLVRFSATADGKTLYGRKDTLEHTFGRLRNIIQSPDGSVIFSSSNAGGNEDNIYRLRWN